MGLAHSNPPQKTLRPHRLPQLEWHLCLFPGEYFSSFFPFFSSLDPCKYRAATAPCGTGLPGTTLRSVQICLQLFALNLPPATFISGP